MYNYDASLLTSSLEYRQSLYRYKNGEVGWYRVLVFNSPKDFDAVIKYINDLIPKRHFMIPLKPFYLHEGGEEDVASDAGATFTFYINSASMAYKLHKLKSLKDGMIIRVNNRQPLRFIDDRYKLSLKRSIQFYFNEEIQCLNLSNFHRLRAEFCALSNDSCMEAVVTVIKNTMPKLRWLILDGNHLSSVSAFHDVEKYLPDLRCLSLRMNKVNSLEKLEVFAALPLTDLWLKTNPIKYKIVSLLKLFPQLERLDGEELSLELRQRCQQAVNLPATKRLYMVTAKSAIYLKQFVERYLKAFDSTTERSALKLFYQENAMISVSFATSAANDDWHKPYSSVGHQDEFELKSSGNAAVAVFSRWPQTVHLLHTITIDLTIVSKCIVCFTLTGIFEEYKPHSKHPPLLRHFMRTVILTPLVDQETSPDFRIANELVHLSDVTRPHLQLRSSITQTRSPSAIIHCSYVHSMLERHMSRTNSYPGKQLLVAYLCGINPQQELRGSLSPLNNRLLVQEMLEYYMTKALQYRENVHQGLHFSHHVVAGSVYCRQFLVEEHLSKKEALMKLKNVMRQDMYLICDSYRLMMLNVNKLQ